MAKACQTGDSEYQEQLFYRYSESLLSTCMRYMGNKSDAEDILHDAFILIFERIHQYQPDKGSLKNWLITICVNQCLKKIKRAKQHLTLESIAEITSLHSIEADMNYDELYQLILSLPMPYRTVVNLYLIEGYSHKEIADILDVKDSSSRSILTRAKQMLQEKITLTKTTKSWTA